MALGIVRWLGVDDADTSIEGQQRRLAAQRMTGRPDVAIVLGSGLGDFARRR